MSEMPEFRYRGARALTILHEQEIRLCVEVWRKAKAAGFKLPESKNPDYVSLEKLLCHVFYWARENMNWMCEKLELPDPQIDAVPEAAEIEAKADEYMEHLLEQFRKPLTEVRGRDFYYRTYTSKWKTDYCIDAMLEHLVMHPMRHRFQLEELL
jgi:uncharacterized damage-inducible protein DinB